MKDFTSIQPGNAINRVANKVVFGHMDHFDITPKATHSNAMHSDIMLSWKRYIGNPVYDFTNKQVGFFTIIGVYKKIGKTKNLSWVVRCRCGSYEIRTAKSIGRKLLLKEHDACFVCKAYARLKNGIYQIKGTEYE